MSIIYCSMIPEVIKAIHQVCYAGFVMLEYDEAKCKTFMSKCDAIAVKAHQDNQLNVYMPNLATWTARANAVLASFYRYAADLFEENEISRDIILME